MNPTPLELSIVAGGMCQLPAAAARVMDKYGRRVADTVRAASVSVRVQQPKQRAIAGLPNSVTPFRFARAMAMAIRPHEPTWGQCDDSPSISPDMIEEFRAWFGHANAVAAGTQMHCTAFRLMGSAFSCTATLYAEPGAEALVGSTMDLRVQCAAAGMLDSMVWVGALTIVHEALANAAAAQVGQLLVYFPELVTTEQTLAEIATMGEQGGIYAADAVKDKWQSMLAPTDKPELWVREASMLASGTKAMGLNQHGIRRVVAPMLAIEEAYNDQNTEPVKRLKRCEELARTMLASQPDWMTAVLLCVNLATRHATTPKPNL